MSSRLATGIVLCAVLSACTGSPSPPPRVESWGTMFAALREGRSEARVSLLGLGRDGAIAGSCPIAHPEGPEPWRFAGALDAVELVGVYVEGAAGRLTHHTHHSHLHVVAPGRTGHLDAVTLRDATLLLPGIPAADG